MSTINQKLGLRPRTRPRMATHGRNLVTDARCPKCGGRHVTEAVLHGTRKRLCGACGEIWIPNA